ncbi:MAG: GC-type dockerin domain-anchored protein, partial [Planctomycetota bacterium]
TSVACSPADVTTDGTSNGVPDGTVTLSDFSFYLGLWATGDPSADVTLTGVCDTLAGGGDGVDLSDFSCYLTEWSAGCP